MSLVAAQIAPVLGDLKAAPTGNDTVIFDNALFRWETADAPYTADDDNIIESDNAPLTSGAWIRQKADSIQDGDGNTVQDALVVIGISVADLDGTGATDVTAAFLARMTLALSTGRPLVLQAGKTYLLSTWSNQAFAADLRIIGNGSTIKGPAASTNFVSPDGAKIDFDGVIFDGWGSVVERLSSSGGTADGLRLVGNTFTNCLGICVNIEVQCSGYEIRENTFSSNSGGYNIRIGHSVYADQDNWQGIIESNRFLSITSSGSTSLAAIIVYGRDTLICNNYINGVSQTGTGECWGIYVKLRRSKIYGNEVYDVTAAGNADNVGINLKGGERSQVDGPQGYSTMAWGNTVRRIGVAGSQGGGIRAQTGDQKVFGNIVEDFGLIGIVVDESSAPVSRISIYHNTVIGTATSGERGIVLSCMGDTIAAVENQIFNCLQGIRTGGGGAQDSFVISGNEIEAPTSGTSVGILVGSSSNALTNLTIEDNKLRGSHTYALRNENTGASTGWRVRRNRLGTSINKMSGTWPSDMVSEDTIVFSGTPMESHTGDTAETSLHNLTIPGGMIGQHGQVEIYAIWSGSGTGGGKNLRIKFGSMTAHSNNYGATTLSSEIFTRIANKTESAQVCRAAAANYSSSTSAPTVGSVPTADDVVVDFTAQLGFPADSMTLESYEVRIHPRYF